MPEHECVNDLLERDELLDALGAALAAGGRMLLVGGEAGAGKTSLVRTFAARAGTPVLQGSCENLATPIPLAPFADIAAAAGGPLAEALDARADPRAVARALLAGMSEPVLVVIEDVHWGDERRSTPCACSAAASTGAAAWSSRPTGTTRP